MSKQNELNSYITRLQRRLRLGAWLHGASGAGGYRSLPRIAGRDRRAGRRVGLMLALAG